MDELGETSLTRLVQDYKSTFGEPDRRYLEAIKALLDSGANPCARTCHNQSLVYVAITVGRCCDLAELLVEAGSSIHNPKGAISKDTLLHCLKDLGQDFDTARIAKFLIKKGLDVSAAGNLCQPPIVNACEAQDPNFLRVLLEHGADAQYADVHRGNLLHVLVSYNWPMSNDRADECIALLVAGGASPNSPLLHGLTPCQSAVMIGEYVDAMVQHGGDLNALGMYGQYLDAPESTYTFPMLHALIRMQHWQYDRVRSHLESGADVAAVDSIGQTALHVATRHPAKQSIIDVLLEFGADPLAKDNAGGVAGTRPTGEVNGPKINQSRLFYTVKNGIQPS